jgi:hypothetical protein
MCGGRRHTPERHKANKLGLIGFVFERWCCKQRRKWLCFVKFLSWDFTPKGLAKSAVDRLRIFHSFPPRRPTHSPATPV